MTKTVIAIAQARLPSIGTEKWHQYLSRELDINHMEPSQDFRDHHDFRAHIERYHERTSNPQSITNRHPNIEAYVKERQDCPELEELLNIAANQNTKKDKPQFINYQTPSIKSYQNGSESQAFRDITNPIIQADFIASSLSWTRFNQALFKHCNFDYSNLYGVHFDRCHFKSSNAYHTRFENTHFKDCLLKNIHFSQCIFKNVTFNNIDFHGVTPKHFFNCSFPQAVHVHANCTNLSPKLREYLSSKGVTFNNQAKNHGIPHLKAPPTNSDPGEERITGEHNGVTFIAPFGEHASDTPTHQVSTDEIQRIISQQRDGNNTIVPFPGRK